MVDSLSNSNALTEANLQQIERQAVEKLTAPRTPGVNTPDAADSTSTDTATISPQALKAYQGEKEMVHFSQLAQMSATPFDTDKVNHFKALASDPEQLQAYLDQLDPNALADSLLNSPFGNALKSANG